MNLVWTKKKKEDSESVPSPVIASANATNYKKLVNIIFAAAVVFSLASAGICAYMPFHYIHTIKERIKSIPAESVIDTANAFEIKMEQKQEELDIAGDDFQNKAKAAIIAELSDNAEGKTALVKAIINGGTPQESDYAAINAADENGRTALMYALIFSDTDTIKNLLQKGAEVSVSDKNKMTPLMYAAAYSSESAALRLNITEMPK